MSSSQQDGAPVNQSLDAALRPTDWSDYVGQQQVKANVRIAIDAAKKRGSMPEHLLFYGPPGVGKTTLAHLIALTLGAPCAVTDLPGFADGEVSVQDGGAQLAAVLLDPRPGERVLDACAAPGGKACHILERAAVELVAVDRDGARLERLHQNLRRLHLVADVIAADAAEPAGWWDGRSFQRIMLDAPCSASGVMRRHPDIKLHRRPSDLERLARGQARLLAGLWPLLAPGGKLLYVTCSILPEENEDQITRFLAEHADAAPTPLATDIGHARAVGVQLLPGEHELDGFYYACLQKRS